MYFHKHLQERNVNFLENVLQQWQKHLYGIGSSVKIFVEYSHTESRMHGTRFMERRLQEKNVNKKCWQQWWKHLHDIKQALQKRYLQNTKERTTPNSWKESRLRPLSHPAIAGKDRQHALGICGFEKSTLFNDCCRD